MLIVFKYNNTRIIHVLIYKIKKFLQKAKYSLCAIFQIDLIVLQNTEDSETFNIDVASPTFTGLTVSSMADSGGTVAITDDDCEIDGTDICG